jgi:hypothetical protein
MPGDTRTLRAKNTAGEEAGFTGVKLKFSMPMSSGIVSNVAWGAKPSAWTTHGKAVW